MKDPLIVVLGHTNSMGGVLSDLAIERAQVAASTLLRYPESKYITTGNYWLNTDDTHASRLESEIYNQLEPFSPNEVNKDAMAFIYSRNTVEDIYFLGQLLTKEKLNPPRITIITSFFHNYRVRYLVRKLLDKKIADKVFCHGINANNKENMHRELEKFYNLSLQDKIIITEETKNHKTPYEVNI